MSRHRLPKADLLQYALSGAVTERGLWSGAMSDEQADLPDKDIAGLREALRPFVTEMFPAYELSHAGINRNEVNCRSSWHQFTSKAERDYAASQAPKLPGYIKHSVGGWKHPRQKEVFTLFIYLKEKP